MRKRPRSWQAAVIYMRRPRSDHAALELPVTLHIPGQLWEEVVAMQAIVDLGASCCFVNQRFVHELGLLAISKKHPMCLCTIDNSEIKSGLLTHEVHLKLMVGDHKEALVFDVANIGNNSLILGVDWLQHHNPTIDWDQSTINFASTHCKRSCLPSRAHVLQGAIQQDMKLVEMAGHEGIAVFACKSKRVPITQS